MTPREKREAMTLAVIDDMMDNIYEGFNLEIIRDALADYFATSLEDMESIFKERALTIEENCHE